MIWLLVKQINKREIFIRLGIFRLFYIIETRDKEKKLRKNKCKLVSTKIYWGNIQSKNSIIHYFLNQLVLVKTLFLIKTLINENYDDDEVDDDYDEFPIQNLPFRFLSVKKEKYT